MSSVSHSLESRLDHLERQNRRQRWLCFGLPAVALLLGAEAGQVVDWKGKSLTTEKLVLVDTEGKSRASLTTGANGAELMMQDGKGRNRVRIAADFEGQGPAVFLVGQNDKVRAVLRSFEDKTGPLLVLANEDGTPNLSAGRSKANGIGFVEFLDTSGTWKGGVGGSGLK